MILRRFEGDPTLLSSPASSQGSIPLQPSCKSPKSLPRLFDGSMLLADQVSRG